MHFIREYPPKEKYNQKVKKKMHPFHITLSILISYIAGIISYSFIQTQLQTTILFAGVVFIMTGIIKIKFILYSLLLIPFSFGLYIHQQKYIIPKNHILHFNGNQKHTITGYISKQPDHRETNSKYTITTQKINNQKTVGKIMLSTQRYPEYNYLDKITFTAKLETPPEDENFSYKNFLSRYEIYSIAKNPKGISISKKRNKTIKEKIYQKIFHYKNKFEENINEILPEPQSSLANGLLLGSKKGLPKEIQENFQITGLTHIVAISGSNIAIIALICMKLFEKLPRKISITTSIIIIIFFTIITGAEAAVVRASITGIISLLAMLSYKKSHTFTTLMMTLAIMLTISPRMFFYDPGFALSFSATLGVIYFHEIIAKITKPLKLPDTLAIKDSFNLTLAAQITTLPIMIILFKKVSLISPIANVLIDPLLSPAMFLPLLSFLSQKISIIHIPINTFTIFYIDTMVIITKFCAEIPFAQIEIKKPHPIVWLIYYALLCFLLKKNGSQMTPKN